MYKDFFKLKEQPFSIVPSSRYIFLSERHQEALYNLQMGLDNGGGFALLTGEVGTGKTTLSKVLLSQLGYDIRTGLLLNPTYSPADLLEAICDEFSLTYPKPATMKHLTQTIYDYLLDNHKNGLFTLLVIDEAQHLSSEVLEQLRLLTNLETDTQKLLKVLLIGQPELQDNLQQNHLRQLAQRITARYHLLPLTFDEVSEYIKLRLNMAGSDSNIFTDKAMMMIAEYTQGIPRLVNLVCEKALCYAYQDGQHQVSVDIAQKACDDALYFIAPSRASALSTANEPIYSAKSAKVSKSGDTSQSTSKKDKLPYFISLFLGVAVASILWFISPQVTGYESLPPPAISANSENTDDLIAPLIDQSNNTIKAMNELIAVWGYSAKSNEGDCRHLTQVNLHCYQGKGEMTDLIKVNRPAVLTMKEGYKTYFSILYKLSDEYAHLLLAGQHIKVPRTWLEEHWSGEYQLLWHSPIKNRGLSLYDKDEEVQDLLRYLSRALGDNGVMPYIYGEAIEFDANVERKISAFQTWQDLEATGKLNEMTLMRLDSISNYDAPVLVYEDLTESLNSNEGDM